MKPAGSFGRPAFTDVPVAAKGTGLPASPVAVAVSVFTPGTAPSVQPPIAASPLPSVVIGFVPIRLPSPEVTANTTPTPGTGLPNGSLTITAGGIATADPAVAP